MRTISTIVFLLLSVSAWAQQWEEFETTSEATFYLDPATIKNQGGAVRVWAVQDFKTMRERNARSNVNLVEINCKEERYRLLALTEYSGQMGQGRSLTTSNSGEWNYIVPRTVMNSLMRRICK